MSRARDNSNYTEAKIGKNLLYNPDFTIWQRGLNFTNVTDAYTADRWKVAAAGAGVNPLLGQNNGASWGPGGSQLNNTDSNVMYINGAASNSYVLLYQRLPPSDVYGLTGKSITMSCWVYHNGANRAFQLAVQHADALADFTSQTNIGFYNITLNSGWNYVEATFDDMPVNAKYGLEFRFFAFGGVTASEVFAVHQPKAEIGTTATAWEPVDAATEMNKCQYFYEYLSTIALSTANTSEVIGANRSHYATQKRVTPTVTAATNAFGATWSSNVDYVRQITGATGFAGVDLHIDAEL